MPTVYVNFKSLPLSDKSSFSYSTGKLHNDSTRTSSNTTCAPLGSTWQHNNINMDRAHKSKIEASIAPLSVHTWDCFFDLLLSRFQSSS